ncbi:SMP-30/gluconolactonase/LRE family protein [Zavarzinia compransoris]|uniref:SMP-30/gluconolactonase/LRE family protein n=1 Tax=Zavarzinia marina TaxID=2911065 RepID=UPI001F3E6034|nr:SMP-30/gluconolactonase/LRE family protein [Zavarzinia marina]MCF4165707.1 SMP-30/gluconolactonase/LRE family protein [Zavarzinia marina]
MNGFREIAGGLRFPEGPVVLPDGDILVVEIERGTLTRVRPDGTSTVAANLGGGPNGAALGPDGAVYVCNNGGFEFADVDGLMVPGHQAHDYGGGSIQRVDLSTGRAETLYTHAGDIALKGPNDIVFDAHGGFWFTDHGKSRDRERDTTGVFYATPDGNRIEEVIFPLMAPNGIGLSPDGNTLYVAETFTGRVWAFDVTGPGRIGGAPNLLGHQGRLLLAPGGLNLFDSLGVDGEGHVCVATLVNGGITSVSPDGAEVAHMPLPDPLTTNICFGGPDLRTAYITLSGTGRLVAVDWPRRGLRLHGG